MAPRRRRRRTDRQQGKRGEEGRGKEKGSRAATEVGRQFPRVCGSGAVQEALIHPRSYAPDGQGRYTTPMYFRGVSLLDSYGSFLRPLWGAQRTVRRMKMEQEDGGAGEPNHRR